MKHLTKSLFFSLFIVINSYTWASDNESWMKNIDDKTPLCQVSIPGAHDAATNGITIGKSKVHVQGLDIEDLFEAGVRCFDLRPWGKKLTIIHGKTRYTCHTNYDEVVDDLVEELKDNPTECAIIVTRIEGNSGDKWNAIRDKLLSKQFDYYDWKYKGHVVRFSPSLTMGDVRGKILFINRFEFVDNGNTGIEPVAAYAENWLNEDSGNLRCYTTKDNGNVWNWCKTELIGQDRYEMIPTEGFMKAYYNPMSSSDVQGKLQAFKDVKEKHHALLQEGECWCFNHVSGYYHAGRNPHPWEFGAHFNQEIIRYFRSGFTGSCGVVMMDFAGVNKYKSYSFRGQELVNLIIEQNKKNK